MPERVLPVDRTSLLDAVTARGEHLLGTWLDLTDGSLHALVDGDDSGASRRFEARMDANPDGFAKVPVYPREYRLMVAFVETEDDDVLAAALDAALAGREAFRRFEAVLATHADEAERWRTFREDALQRWAVAWLRGLSLTVGWAAPVVDPERPALLEWLTGDGVVERPCADRNAARDLFVRVCREVCELVREPFKKSDVRGRNRFVRGGVEIVVDGATVRISRVS